MAEPQYVILDKFFGVNKQETETLLELGEASEMSNWTITDDLKLKKQYGYKSLNASVAGKKVNGMWWGKINGVDHFLFARGGKVYEYDFTAKTEVEIGTIVDAYPTTFFASNNVVYILDGTEFYQWDGTTFKQVEGYVPLVVSGAPPTGGGTLVEGINYISGKKKMKFSADGNRSLFQLMEDNIDSVDSVFIGPDEQGAGVDYTVDLTYGTVSFVNPPPEGANNIEISWTKEDAEFRKRITNCRYYGGVYYARFWLFGNPNYRNTRFPSGVTQHGVSDPTYWPYASDSTVGEHEITDILTQYDKQIIFTSGDSSGASAWYSTSESYTDPNSGLFTTIFPTFPINAKVGNIAMGQTRIILNNPFTIWKGVYEWVSTYVMNEKNAVWISQRIQRDLDKVDLSKAITWDWDENGLYLLCVGKRIWVYNYRVTGARGERGAWYILDLPHEPTCFVTVDRKLCFGTTDGQIMMFDENEATFDGEEIIATWDMGYHNFGADWIRKFIQMMFISIVPYISTHVDIYLSTDRDATFRFVKTVYYGLSNFDTWDFSGIDVPGYETKGFSFETNFSPQPKRVKLKAKKIDYMKIRLVCGGTDGATVLSITLPTRTGGLVKNR
jgi:hypothetical protein